MPHPQRVIFLFLDGVGLDSRSKANPFAAADCRFLPFHRPEPRLPDRTPVTAVDAGMGVAGIPQSASGQATLFTGINIPALMGHRGSYPGAELRRLLYRDNLLKGLRACGRRVGFLNAYPHYSGFFQPPHLELHPDGDFLFSAAFPRRFRRLISTTTCMMLSSGLVPRDEDDIRNGRALYQEFTNTELVRLGLELPLISPERAAEIMAEAAKEVDLLLFEFFQTDLYAHRREFTDCIALVRRLDRLTGRLLEYLDPQRDTLILTSDHGNLEDCSQRSHTRNPVPLLAWGRGGDRLRARVNTLADVTPAVRELLACPAPTDSSVLPRGTGRPQEAP